MEDFQKIYETYVIDVYKYTLSLCRDDKAAEEITQETFYKALKNIQHFDGKCKLFVWLCQIAKNTYFNQYEKDKRFVPMPENDMESRDISVEEMVMDKESAFEIHKVLHILAEPYKEVFSLRVFGELSFRQIGDLFHKTESWARVTYYRAKVQIKEGLR